MGLLEILTIIFVVLKFVGVITWSWWLVLSPLWVALGLYVVIVGFMARTTHKISKSFKK